MERLGSMTNWKTTVKPAWHTNGRTGELNVENERIPFCPVILPPPFSRVHPECIQTPSPFPHFDVTKCCYKMFCCYSLILKWIKLLFSLINLHTIPHNNKANTCFLETNNRNTLFTYVFRPFAMRLGIELRCILFPLIILEMFLQLDWSPLVVN
jgi:hypothetical protein